MCILGFLFFIVYYNLFIYTSIWICSLHDANYNNTSNTNTNDLKDALQPLRGACLRCFPEFIADLRGVAAGLGGARGQGGQVDVGTGVADFVVAVSCLFASRGAGLMSILILIVFLMIGHAIQLSDVVFIHHIPYTIDNHIPRHAPLRARCGGLRAARTRGRELEDGRGREGREGLWWSGGGSDGGG